MSQVKTNTQPKTSSEPAEPTLESLQALFDATSGYEPEPDGDDIDESRQRENEQAIKERETERQGREHYFQLRDRWSWFIFGFVCSMIILEAFLAIAIGYGWMNFEHYKYVVSLVLGENFAQIVGMGIIVSKFLFPTQDQ